MTQLNRLNTYLIYQSSYSLLTLFDLLEHIFLRYEPFNRMINR